MDNQTSLDVIKGVGSAAIKKLNGAGLFTVGDFLDYYPRRYDDYSHVSTISSLKPGLVSLRVTFANVSSRRARRGIYITEAVASDASGSVKVIWFNQPYRKQSIQTGKAYLLNGDFKFQNGGLQIINPQIELADEVKIETGSKIVPVYRETGQLSSVLLRKIASQLETYMETLDEVLPEALIKKYGLVSYAQAIRGIHAPKDARDLDDAKKRLAFNELFVVVMAAQLNRLEAQKISAPKIEFIESAAKEFVGELPFVLTDSQRKVVWQIYKDMQRPVADGLDDSALPMNRLVEGDVGSGKTVVATMASLMALKNGYQVAFIAPTELLARQHAETIVKMLEHTEFAQKIALLVGSVKEKDKKIIKENIKSGHINLVIGTHALLEKTVVWKNLGLVVIDEQHRFGVEQRQKLHLKAGHMPHILCLTATPIPRSLALTVYGELDISIIDTAPSERAGVVSEIISPNSTKQMYNHIRDQLKQGRQAYVVCPLINESDVLQVASAEETFKKLRQTEFKGFKVGLLHGKLKTDEKDAVMQAFINKEVDVLVSTTVIEVGVDVKNASVMVILSADRFGLAQLHQLRGRVGRGEHKGYCYFVMSDSKAPPRRIRELAVTANGFELAELDLEIRGPGAIYGTRQHGALDFKIAKLTDAQLIAITKKAVDDFMQSGEDLLKYKQIAHRVTRASKLTYLN
jgi:ATP-dependent DNA helicase RecG